MVVVSVQEKTRRVVITLQTLAVRCFGWQIDRPCCVLSAVRIALAYSC